MRTNIVIDDKLMEEALRATGPAGDRPQDQARSGRAQAAARHAALGGPDIAVRAARHHRLLRARGVTVRKTIDTVIATRGIVDDIPLLHADRAFDPFETHLGLKVVA